MAQFSHSDFGGMAQWSSGGMSMIGDMFNNAVKAKFDAMMSDLAAAIGNRADLENHAKDSAHQTSRHPAAWWPEKFRDPASSGSQNDMRYAFFPDAQRLVVDDHGKRTIYDTGSHRISGVSQQQSTSRTIAFTSQRGTVMLTDLRVVE
jgi:uncharacterized protein YcbX